MSESDNSYKVTKISKIFFARICHWNSDKTINNVMVFMLSSAFRTYSNSCFKLGVNPLDFCLKHTVVLDHIGTRKENRVMIEMRVKIWKALLYMYRSANIPSSKKWNCLLSEDWSDKKLDKKPGRFLTVSNFLSFYQFSSMWK